MAAIRIAQEDQASLAANGTAVGNIRDVPQMA
jgi:hypothetical protein